MKQTDFMETAVCRICKKVVPISMMAMGGRGGLLKSFCRRCAAKEQRDWVKSAKSPARYNAKRSGTPRRYWQQSCDFFVWRMVKTGILLRRGCCIEGCETKTVASSHHSDYTRPMHIEWMCPSHHKRWHVKNSAIWPTEEQLAELFGAKEIKSTKARRQRQAEILGADMTIWKVEK